MSTEQDFADRVVDRVFGDVDFIIADLRTRDLDGLMLLLVKGIRKIVADVGTGPVAADRIASRIRDRLIVEQEIQRALVGRETDEDHQ